MLRSARRLQTAEPVKHATQPVVVIGSGICGAATALFLQDLCVAVLLLERGELSGGTTGLGQGNVLGTGHQVWHALSARFPTAVALRVTGSLTVGTDLDHGPGEFFHEARELEPALRPGLTGRYVARDLCVDARSAARTMAGRVPHRTHAEVVVAEARSVTLKNGERIAAAAVVLALGPWSGTLAPELDVRPQRGQIVALRPPAGLLRHTVIDATYLAAVIGEAPTGEVFVGSTREDVGFDPGAPHGAALVARAARFVPALADAPVTRTWVGYRPYRPDGPFVGRLGLGVYAITGHAGSGVARAPMDAARLARQIRHELHEG